MLRETSVKEECSVLNTRKVMKVNYLLLFLCINFTFALMAQVREAISKLNPLNVFFSNYCTDDLGCFYTGPPFYDVLCRPISVAPRLDVDTKFQLFTPQNPHDKYDLEINRTSLLESPFNSTLETKVLIHGFISDLNLNDFRFIMKKAMLDWGDYNIIIVDWTSDNGHPYNKAVANARTTGALVAKLINFIINTTDAKAENFHIVGHSLGAHLAGYAGERIPNLGRITGLDPAGPYFQVDDARVRLDPTDALFVDVIHTNAAESVFTGYGIRDPLGHMDFYPNGGRSQPGCDVITRTSEIIFRRSHNSSAKFMPAECDHERANEFFASSVNATVCQFTAVMCDDYEEYVDGLCNSTNSRVATMGFHTKLLPELSVPSKFFLKTNATFPYCM